MITPLRLCLLLVAATGSTALAAPRQRVVPASDLLIKRESPTVSWRWRAPPEAAQEPGLLSLIRAEALKDVAAARRDADRDAAEAKKAGFPFRRYDYATDWQVAADTPRLLALTAESYAFTGGAHGNTAYAVKLWDKAGNRGLPIDALFTDWPRARKLLEPAFCKALDEERGRRRGGAAATMPEFDACPKLSEMPVVPHGGLGSQARQFRVLVAPYNAGPYSEGSYIITAPWPNGIAALVKPAYRADLGLN